LDFLHNLGVQSLLLFATTVFVVNATPGADMLLTFTNTMKLGVRGGVATSAGISTGSLVHTAFVALGVAALLAASPAAFKAVQWAGAAYLVWIAVSLAREAFAQPASALSDDEVMDELRGMGSFEPAMSGAGGAAVSAVAPAPSSQAAGGQAAAAQAAAATPARATATARGPFVQGLVTNVLNPKVALFFMALLPQFVAPTVEPKWPALAFLGAWFAVQGFAFLVAFVRVVAVLRRWQPSPRRRRALYLLASIAILLVALRLTGSAPGG
jgi:threonine/homoserine/homoserine lactone efflux protein